MAPPADKHLPKRKPSPSQIHSDESHIGGTLAELSERGGTAIPADAGTQRTVPSEPHQRTNKALRGYPPSADNTKGMPQSPGDMTGATGEVVTGTGDLMPPGVEGKHVGSSRGGKHGGEKRHVKGSGTSADIN
ncbi:hypothetical protein EDC01DRAFT_627109 [Geopyxis carbonaria]|nr:hypothetical protein EDC01DRAFT_627109 [Geopyxis carbonaria]